MDPQIIEPYIVQKIAAGLFRIELYNDPNIGKQISLVMGLKKVSLPIPPTVNVYDFATLDDLTKRLAEMMLEKLDVWELSK